MTFESVELAIIKIETVLCRDPKVSVFVFDYMVDVIIANTKWIGRIISLYCKIVAIVNIDSIFCRDPYKTHFVLMNITNVALWKTLFDREMVESDFLWKQDARHQKGSEQK